MTCSSWDWSRWRSTAAWCGRAQGSSPRILQTFKHKYLHSSSFIYIIIETHGTMLHHDKSLRVQNFPYNSLSGVSGLPLPYWMGELALQKKIYTIFVKHNIILKGRSWYEDFNFHITWGRDTKYKKGQPKFKTLKLSKNAYPCRLYKYYFWDNCPFSDVKGRILIYI